MNENRMKIINVVSVWIKKTSFTGRARLFRERRSRIVVRAQPCLMFSTHFRIMFGNRQLKNLGTSGKHRGCKPGFGKETGSVVRASCIPILSADFRMTAKNVPNNRESSHTSTRASSVRELWETGFAVRTRAS